MLSSATAIENFPLGVAVPPIPRTADQSRPSNVFLPWRCANSGSAVIETSADTRTPAGAVIETPRMSRSTSTGSVGATFVGFGAFSIFLTAAWIFVAVALPSDCWISVHTRGSSARPDVTRCAAIRSGSPFVLESFAVKPGSSCVAGALAGATVRGSVVLVGLAVSRCPVTSPSVSSTAAAMDRNYRSTARGREHRSAVRITCEARVRKHATHRRSSRQDRRSSRQEQRSSRQPPCTPGFRKCVDRAGGAAYKQYRMNVHSIKRGRPLVDDKRRRILDAALTTFAERGYHGTAVPEVAQAAKVSPGTLYHYFASKELLVNEVYRDAKTRLRAALLAELPALDPYSLDRGRAWFTALGDRLGAFARAEPDAFRFLEMQDHAPYLDGASRALELSVLAPHWVPGQRLTARGSDAPPVDVAIALLWGAFVGLIKASRLGYLKLDDATLAKAGAACWRMIAPPLPRTGEAPPPK